MLDIRHKMLDIFASDILSTIILVDLFLSSGLEEILPSSEMTTLFKPHRFLKPMRF